MRQRTSRGKVGENRTLAAFFPLMFFHEMLLGDDNLFIHLIIYFLKRGHCDLKENRIKGRPHDKTMKVTDYNEILQFSF